MSPEATTTPYTCAESAATTESCAAFFRRNGFDARRTRSLCDELVRCRFPGSAPRPVEPQGYCSYTLAVGAARLVQFRPAKFVQGLAISAEAREIYGALVPAMEDLGVVCGFPAESKGDGLGPGRPSHDGSTQESNSLHLHIFVMDRVPGIPLADFREMVTRIPIGEAKAARRRLVEDIADVFTLGLERCRHYPPPSASSSNSPNPGSGYVWRTLSWRLPLLQSLPSGSPARRALDAVAQQGRLAALEQRLPWCLTHGDLVPANVMVDPASGRLTGLIDWAEGEWLPFGVGLYGLEELLGEETPHEEGRFRYYVEHNELRQLFWTRLLRRWPEAENDEEEKTLSRRPCGGPHGPQPQLWLEDTALARKLGVLLWRGLAFEDGRIDRVVEPGRDDVDIAKLNAFLLADDGLGVLRRHQQRSQSRSGFFFFCAVWTERLRWLWDTAVECLEGLVRLLRRPREKRKKMVVVSKVVSVTSSSAAD